MRASFASKYSAVGILLASIVGFASPASGETLKGQTVLASYPAPGLCAESNRSNNQVKLAVCARKADQDFHMERFDDIAQQVSWQKIMNGKNCLQAGYLSGRANLTVERCSISTWSRSAFWSISSSSGDLYSREEYCPYRNENGVAIGTVLVAEKCRWFDGPELYPAIATKAAKVGPEILAAVSASQQIRAIVIENGFSGGNLVASSGAFLKIDRNGNVSATNGGEVIAGGAGYLIESALSKIPGAVVLRPANYSSKKPDDLAPKSLDFFKEEKDRGKITYDPR